MLDVSEDDTVEGASSSRPGAEGALALDLEALAEGGFGGFQNTDSLRVRSGLFRQYWLIQQLLQLGARAKVSQQSTDPIRRSRAKGRGGSEGAAERDSEMGILQTQQYPRQEAGGITSRGAIREVTPSTSYKGEGARKAPTQICRGVPRERGRRAQCAGLANLAVVGWHTYATMWVV